MSKVIHLGEAHGQQALEILTKAFRADPMVQQVFPTERLAQCFFRFLLAKGRALNELPLGVDGPSGLAAVASLERPNGGAKANGAFLLHCLQLFRQIPLRSFAFINRYMQVTTAVRPKAPHHYLVFIGVDPLQQGRGIGKLLLNRIHELVDQDPTSTGIGLDTENPENVRLYERFGYRLVATRQIGEVMVFCMFRSPKGGL